MSSNMVSSKAAKKVSFRGLKISLSSQLVSFLAGLLEIAAGSGCGTERRK